MRTPMANAEMKERLSVLIDKIRDLEIEAITLHEVSDGPYRNEVFRAFSNLESAETNIVAALRILSQ